MVPQTVNDSNPALPEMCSQSPPAELEAGHDEVGGIDALASKVLKQIIPS